MAGRAEVFEGLLLRQPEWPPPTAKASRLSTVRCDRPAIVSATGKNK